MATERRVVRIHGIGGGRLECDGKNHWHCVEDHVALNCLPETHAGPCRDPIGCQRLAEKLAASTGTPATGKAI